ncbi:lysophospholipid acyltransferase family protein, partial [Enterobacter roggenkampii]
LLIFPEGTRTRSGEAISLQRGAANIAVRCNSDLRVVLIHCSEHLLDKKSRWYDVPPEKPVFTVDVRDRVNIDEFYDANEQEPALAARQLNRHLQHRLTSGLQSLSGINDASALS